MANDFPEFYPILWRLSMVQTLNATIDIRHFL